MPFITSDIRYFYMSFTQNLFDVLVKLWQETAIDDNEYQYANTYFIFSQGCTDTDSIIENCVEGYICTIIFQNIIYKF